jgi:hypothetical protein
MESARRLAKSGHGGMAMDNLKPLGETGGVGEMGFGEIGYASWFRYVGEIEQLSGNGAYGTFGWQI